MLSARVLLMCLVLSLFASHATAETTAEELYSLDGSTVSGFTCFESTSPSTPAPIVDLAEGVPAPAMRFQPGSQTAMAFAPFVLSELTEGQILVGELDFMLVGSTGYANLASFAVLEDSACVYQGPVVNRWPIPSVGYRASAQRLDWWSIASDGEPENTVQPNGTLAIDPNVWHHIEYRFSLAPDGYYDWSLDLDGERIVEERSYVAPEPDAEYSLLLGVGGSGEYSDILYDNVSLRIACDDLDSDGFCPPDDCDDSAANVSPGQPELPGNFDDENCDGDLGSCDPCDDWRNRGHFIRCVARRVNNLVRAGDLTQREGDRLVVSAVRSRVGKRGYVPEQCPR